MDESGLGLTAREIIERQQFTVITAYEWKVISHGIGIMISEPQQEEDEQFAVLMHVRIHRTYDAKHGGWLKKVERQTEFVPVTLDELETMATILRHAQKTRVRS
jgi:hypothetical protein